MKMVVEECSFYNIPADPCRTTFMEVPVGELQGKNILADPIGVWVERCTKDHGNNNKNY